MTLTAVQQIDQQIDAVRAEMIRRVGFAPLDRRGFQNAWRRQPTLARRNHDLYVARHAARQAEYAAEEKAAAKAKRDAARADRRAAKESFARSKCPTCGFHTLPVAA